jgi:hypothetical protein
MFRNLGKISHFNELFTLSCATPLDAGNGEIYGYSCPVAMQLVWTTTQRNLLNDSEIRNLLMDMPDFGASSLEILQLCGSRNFNKTERVLWSASLNMLTDSIQRK